MVATHDHDECPDLEDIAAFLDGTLPVAGRARLIRHLNRCERCYELYAGAADILSGTGRLEAVPAEARRPFDPADAVRGDAEPAGGRVPAASQTPAGDRVPAASQTPAGDRVPAATQRPAREREPGAGGRRAASTRRRVWQWSAAAALAALLAVAAGALLLRWRDQQLVSPERYARYVAGNALAASPFPWGRTLRGAPGEPAEAALGRTSFKLGIRLLDLRAALAAGDARSAADALRRLRLLLDKEVELPPPGAQEAYEKMARQLEGGVPPRSLLPAAAAQEKRCLEESATEPLYVGLGSWSEACRLAGEAGQPRLFRDRASRRLLAKVVEPGEDDATQWLGEPAGALLRGLRADLAAGRIDPAALGQRCRSLLELIDPD
jgi:Putative zinc-finger